MAWTGGYNNSDFSNFSGTNKNSSTLQINSLNVNGLEKKVGKVVDFMNKNDVDILLLQETHLFNVDRTTRFFNQAGLTPWFFLAFL